MQVVRSPFAFRTRRSLVAATLCFVAALTDAQAARLALLIGNDAYSALNPLQNAAKDARDMAAVLRQAGFDVPDKWVVQNGTRQQMDAALQDFVARIRPDDEVVFYYSGHGVQIGPIAALAPVDIADPSRRPLDGSTRPLSELALAEQQVLDQSISLNRVAADIAGRGARFSLLVVDACRDNPIVDLLRAANAGRSAGPLPTTGLIADPAADSQVLLFSASKGQRALDRLGPDDPVRNGVFTRVLMDAIRRPGVGLRELLPRVRQEVRRLAASQQGRDGQPHRQEPRTMASYDAPDFVFNPTPGTPAATARVDMALPAAVAPRPQLPAPVPAAAPMASPVGRWVGAADCGAKRYPLILEIRQGAGADFSLSLVQHLNLKQNVSGEMVALPADGQVASRRFVVRFEDDRLIPLKNAQRFEWGVDGELRSDGGAGRCKVLLWPSSESRSFDRGGSLSNLSGRWAAELECRGTTQLVRFTAVRVSASEYRLQYFESIGKGDEARLLLHQASLGTSRLVFWQMDDRFTSVKDGQWLRSDGATLVLEAAEGTSQCKGSFHRQ